MRRVSGFTLVECMVAALVLSIGVMSVVASTAAIQQLSLLGRRTAGAAEVAASRLAALSVTSCAAPAGGSSVGVYDEQWTVSASGPLRVVALAVTFQAGNRPRTLRFDASFRCPP